VLAFIEALSVNGLLEVRESRDHSTT
jgi:hypothetical protein